MNLPVHSVRVFSELHDFHVQRISGEVIRKFQDLAVNQATKLTDENNMIPIFLVLGEKVGPLLAAPVIPGTVVEDLSTLIAAMTQTGKVQEHLLISIEKRVRVVNLYKNDLV